jgi:hypothetical protein
MSKHNPLLKRAYEEHDYTGEQILELDKCSRDPIYMIDKYAQIQHPVRGSIPFALRPYQRRVLDAFHNHRLSITLAPRQIGKSWLAGAYLLWHAMFNKDQTVLILSNKNDNAMELIHRIRFIYERMPNWLKPGLTADGWNKHSVAFDNGSRIISQATSENSGRGLAISLLFLDEFAFVRDSIAEEFWTSISPTIATGGKCLITSTPNGDTNRFAILWRGALSRETRNSVGINGFYACSVEWNEPPDRDEDFKQAEIAKIGETRWKQEYECEFLSSDPTLIDAVVLANIWKEVEHNKAVGALGEVRFFQAPRGGVTYLVGIDPSSGNGNDFTDIEVYEFPSMVQVAQFRSNTASTVITYHILKKLLAYLEKTGSTVYFSVENNGLGEALIALYEQDDYPPAQSEFVSEAGQGRRGMATTGKSKIKGCFTLKEMVERGSLTVKSPITAQELKDFIRRGGTYGAKYGATDDSVMATIIVIRLLQEIASFDQDAYDSVYEHSYEVEDAVVEDYDNYLDATYAGNGDDAPLGMLF